VTVGNVDRVYGMEWTVELLLRPKSTLLEERVSLNNRSDVRHRFYWWNNAGVQVEDNSRIEYPMRYAAHHGFAAIQPWPVDESGADLSIIRNHTKGPVSLFVYGSREPFMGIWQPKTDSGVVHYADYGDLPGKKIWSWGVDADGLDWRKALSDNDSAYVEVQAGLFRNQETYAFLQPRQTIHFSEYWMPVRGIGGISRANLTGVVNLSRDGGKLKAAFNANQSIPGAAVRILDGDRVLFSEKADLTPERTWSHEVAMPDAQRKYTFELRNATGAILLSQTEGKYDWTPKSEVHVGPQASYHIPEADKRSEDDWIQLGKDQEQNGDLLKARNTYEQALQKFPKSFDLGKSAGRLAASLLLYDEAVERLEPVQRRDTPDPEIAYYLGIAYSGLGETRKTLTAFEAAQRLPSFHAAGTLQLGELRAREGDWQDAKRYLAESLRSGPDDVRTAEELVAVTRAAGEADSARSLAKTWLAKSPVSYFLREELGEPDLAHLAADPYRVLNVAAEYMRLGQYKQALDVLSREYPAVPADRSEPGSVLPQKHPLVAYYRGYCREKLGQSGAADYATASKLSTAYVFPNSAETLAVLHSALSENAHDGTAHYLLGTFYFSRDLTDRALAEWDKARESNSNIPVLDASRGLALLRVKKEPERALKAFQHGATTDPNNDQIYFGMDQALSLLARPASERAAALARYPNLANMPTELVYELALNRAEAGDYDGAISLFHNRFFAREEGGTNVRQVWVEVRLQQALALAKAGKCDAALTAGRQLGSAVPGLSFTQDGLAPYLNSARTQYLLGSLESQCGRAQDAEARFRQAAQATQADQLIWARGAAKKLGDYDDTKWSSLIQNALAHAEARAQAATGSSSSLYTAGALESAVGNQQAADAKFKEALLLPDRLLAYHMIRLAREGGIPE
jgi:predicted Zn-dependent protease